MTTPNTAVTVQTAPLVPIEGKDDLAAPSVLLALAVAFTGLLGWLFRVHHKLANVLRDLQDVIKAAATNKGHIEQLQQNDNGKEVRLVKLEADVTHIRETIDRSEGKLDRITDILTLGRK